MNYEELLTLVQDTLQRGDIAHAAPQWMRLAEARFNRDLRVQQMIQRATRPLDKSFIPLPENWLETRNVELYTDPVRPLHKITMQEADLVRARGEREPRYYVVHGASLEVVPVVTDPVTIEMTYYARIPNLSTVEPTNWLSIMWPDLYLYGTLLHSAPYLDQDPRLQMWSEIYDRMIEEVRIADVRAQHSGSPLRIRFQPIG